MPIETPLLKVSRPVAACSRCRAAKIKCDGKLPSCSACEKNGKATECASANDNFARGKERSYVSTLETRIEKLQARLREAQQRKSSIISMTDGDLELAKAHAAVTDEQKPLDKYQKAAKRQEARDIDELVSDFGYLAVNATARDYYGFTTFMSYPRLILSACTKDALPKGPVAPLPPRQQGQAMIQHYMDNVFTILPYFEETSLYYSFDAVYRAEQDSNAVVTENDIWNVRFILAITNAFLSEQRGDQFNLDAIGHVKAALEHAERVLKPGTIANVQALLFLTEYSLLDPRHFDSWTLVGAASRAMIDLGLHQDPTRGAGMRKSKIQLRRRVFQCVYILDRSSAIVQSRAFSFSDDSAHVVTPFNDSDSAPTTHKWLKQFHHAVDVMKIRRIQSRWYHDMFQSGRDAWQDPYSYIWQTYHSMTNWFNNISRHTSPPMRIHHELDLLYSYVYILGISPHVQKPHPYAQTLLFEHCIAYASLLRASLNSPNYIAPVTFEDNMRAYMTGMQLLDVLKRSRDQVISGVAPEPPHTAQGGASAPPLPPLSDSAYTNVVRAIESIGHISEALTTFGRRWGYDTWRDDFSARAEPLLNALNGRLWELQQNNTEGVQRPPLTHSAHSNSSIGTISSMSHHHSVGQLSPPITGPTMQGHNFVAHPVFQQPSMTGPQLRALRNSFGGSHYNPYGTLAGSVSPPSVGNYAVSSATPNSLTASSASSPLQNFGSHPMFTPSPPPVPQTSMSQHYFVTPPTAGPTQSEDPNIQFANWAGMMPPQHRPGMHRTHS